LNFSEPKYLHLDGLVAVERVGVIGLLIRPPGLRRTSSESVTSWSAVVAPALMARITSPASRGAEAPDSTTIVARLADSPQDEAGPERVARVQEEAVLAGAEGRSFDLCEQAVHPKS
jgi:hypothetical protein